MLSYVNVKFCYIKLSWIDFICILSLTNHKQTFTIFHSRIFMLPMSLSILHITPHPPFINVHRRMLVNILVDFYFLKIYICILLISTSTMFYLSVINKPVACHTICNILFSFSIIFTHTYVCMYAVTRCQFPITNILILVYTHIHTYLHLYIHIFISLSVCLSVNSLSILSSFTCSCHFPLATCHFKSYVQYFYLRNYLQHCIRCHVFSMHHKVVAFITNIQQQQQWLDNTHAHTYLYI